MPLLQVTAAQGALKKSDQDALMSRLTNALLEAERAPIDDAGAQSLAWAYYIEQPAGTIYVGGGSLDKAPLRIAVTTPEGALNKETRAEFVAAVGKIVDDIVGPYEGRLNHWTMLTELDEGSWAGAGQIFYLADIKAAMNIKVA
ncbi:hypothetical protein [Kiloniella sp.]|uniref:hypothetical protein n=1 Tax=Kiloniella sp. TaxID=1938587 RepID=UPI003B0210D0